MDMGTRLPNLAEQGGYQGTGAGDVTGAYVIDGMRNRETLV